MLFILKKNLLIISFLICLNSLSQAVSSTWVGTADAAPVDVGKAAGTDATVAGASFHSYHGTYGMRATGWGETASRQSWILLGIYYDTNCWL